MIGLRSATKHLYWLPPVTDNKFKKIYIIRYVDDVSN